jgi:CO/xanthine dehydrogenase FAD-binding subunit
VIDKPSRQCMKPPVFDYVRPTTLHEALRLLSESSDDAKLLAGGQSLVPALNFRLAAPRLLIDINALPALDRISATVDGLLVGALTRWYQAETSAVVGSENPLLARAVRDIAHYQIRNRGTFGGSCAHADPAAELPAVLLACDATLVLRSENGERMLPASEFFRGALDTALLADEMIVELRFPPWPARRRWAFEEFSRRRGDFAITGVAVLVDEDASGTCTDARLVVFGAGDKPTRLKQAETMLYGKRLTSDVISTAAISAAREVDARSDIHAPAEYRQALTGLLIKRSLCQAAGIANAEAA